MNIPNKLKNKVIKKEKLTEEEITLFLNYIIHKTIIITNHMYDKNYKPIFLLYEICWSYNIDINPMNIDNWYYAIIELNNKKYILDPNFNSNKIESLNKNKYIEYTEDNYKKYKDIIRSLK